MHIYVSCHHHRRRRRLRRRPTIVDAEKKSETKAP